MITSTGNPQVKNLIQLVKKAKVRNEQRLFVVEGIRMFREAPADWVEQVYVSESFLREHGSETLLQRTGYEVLSDKVFGAVSDTQTPQGVLCLLRMPEYTLADVLGETCPARSHAPAQAAGMKVPAAAPHVLLLESIQDPGNLGTMVRTGEGAGISGIIMNATTVDVFNPKVIRATMGSIFRIPFVTAEDFPGTLRELKRRGVRLFAAHLEGACSYEEPDYTGGTGFLIGNEGNGLSEEIASMADSRIRIPMAGQVESLNAAIAATLLMYEAARQRR